MKLIDILVRDLPKRGGWPIGVSKIEQSSEGRLFDYSDLERPYLFGEMVFDLADDWNDDLGVTREQYEAALAASKPEWDGEITPPVGADVEVLNSVTGRWYPVRMVYSSGRNAAWIELDGSGNIDSSSSSLTQFRPIRSESDKKRDEVEKGIADALFKDGDFDWKESLRLATFVYGAISNNEIPHIRIE
ncbi:hypothetical protein [Lelliottia amnigena]|uniref:hypothetical protein n=1 Tax=Lelliottia amnigena TaxID=61646 RepID=UPI003BA33159